MKEAVDDIMVTLNEAASEVGMVGNMVDSIAEAMSKVCNQFGVSFRLLRRFGWNFWLSKVDFSDLGNGLFSMIFALLLQKYCIVLG